MDPSRLRALLLDLGYSITEHKDGRYACTLIRLDERWSGSGTTPTAALDDAVKNALPSHLGAHLLAIALASDPSMAAGAKNEPTDLGEVQAPPPEPPAERAVEQPATIPSAVPQTTREEPGTPETLRSVEPPSAPASQSPSFDDVSEASRITALQAIDAVKHEMETERDELALCTTQRQRIALTDWIATVRVYEEAFAQDDQIHNAVRSVAGMATRFSKAWWPGRVAALGLQARPEHGVIDLALLEPARIESWDELRIAAERSLSRIEAEDEAAGRDEYGWADARECEPSPDAPDDMLSDVVREIETRAGTLFDQPDDRALPHSDELLHWVRMLRWLRPHVRSSHRWASAMGRCRYWVHGRRLEFADAITQLDPGYRPPLPWARLLGRPTPRDVPELAATPLPPLESDASAADLTRWLFDVLSDPNTDHDQIVERLKPMTEAVLALDSDVVAAGERSVRRRLSKVKRKLSDGGTTPQTESAPATAATVTRLRPPDPVLSAVRERVRGQRALVVTNRDDPELRERLKAVLPFASVEIRRSDPRRVDAVIDAVTVRSFDIVLAATGFLDHRTDGVIKAACDRSGVTYVRVVKGRPAACVRALAREFGINEHGAEDAA